MKNRPDSPKSQTDALAAFARDFSLEHAANGQTFVSIPCAGSYQVVPVFHPFVRQFLQRRYIQDYAVTPSESSLRRAVDRLDALALGNKLPGRAPAFRVDEHPEPTRCIGLDVDNLNTLTISKTGWEIESRSGLNFLRGDGATELP